MKKYVLFILLMSMITANAQLENNNWVFGYNKGLNFSNTVPTILTGTAIEATRGSATVSDSTGQLLLYTDGETLFNKNGGIIADDLLGFKGATQAAIFVPKPGSSNIYYLFTGSGWSSGLNGNHYSEIDINLNGGLGGIVAGQKNIPLKDHLGSPILNSRSEKLTSYTNCNIDYTWVVIQYKSYYYAYKVDNNGVTNAPVDSPAMVNAFNNHGTGNLKISPDGEKIAATFGSAIVLGSINQLHLSKFDFITGEVTDGQTIFSPGYYPDTFIGAYGVEFSPDSSKLYFTAVTDLLQLKTSNKSNKKKPTNKSTLYQYNLTIKAPTLETVWTDPVNGNYNSVWGLQRAIDGKIYVTTGSNYLSVINNPNEIANLCNYTHKSLLFYPTQTYQFDLPQWVYTNKFSDSWALDFGSTNPLHYEFVRKINAVETDEEGNIYVLSTNLGEHSTQLTALANGNDFTQGGAFLAKFNPCKELIAFRNLSITSSEASYGYLHISKDNSLYVSFLNSVYKINSQTLQEVDDNWSHFYTIHPVYHKRNIITDSFNNNLFYARESKSQIDNNYIVPGIPNISKPLIAKLNINTGLAENYYEFNLYANQSGSINNIVAYNNNIYVSGTIYSTTSSTSDINFPTGSINIDHYNSNNNNYSGDFIAKLTLVGNTYTPVAIKQGGGKLLFNNSYNILYSVYNMDTQLGYPIIYNNTSSEIIAHSGDLTTTLFTINTNNKVSDLHLKEQDNSLFLTFHSTASSPTFLQKYDALNGSLIWEANETITGDNYMVSSQIATFNNNIYLTGLYKSNLPLPQTGLPNSLNNTTDLFAIQLKDLGTSFEYRVLGNNLPIALTPHASTNTLNTNDKTVFNIYPNPFNNSLTINTTVTTNKTYTISISDFLGINKLNMVYNTNLQRNAIINTSQLKKGIYVLHIMENGSVVHTRKLIK